MEIQTGICTGFNTKDWAEIVTEERTDSTVVWVPESTGKTVLIWQTLNWGNLSGRQGPSRKNIKIDFFFFFVRNLVVAHITR